MISGDRQVQFLLLTTISKLTVWNGKPSVNIVYHEQKSLPAGNALSTCRGNKLNCVK